MRKFALIFVAVVSLVILAVGCGTDEPRLIILEDGTRCAQVERGIDCDWEERD